MDGTEARPDAAKDEFAETCEVQFLRPPSQESGETVPASESTPQKEHVRRRVSIRRGITLLEAARIAGFPIGTECGGFGKCTRCRAIPLSIGENGEIGPNPPPWLAPPNAAERRQLNSEELESGWRLSCQLKVEGNLAALAHHPSDKVSRKSIDTSIPLLLEPWAERIALSLEPGAEDALAAIRHSLEASHREGRLKEMPRLDDRTASRINKGARKAQKESTISITIADGAVVDVEAGDTSKQILGAVVDIGSTNVCGYLIHLINGALLAEASRPNSQRTWGGDLMSRVHAASSRSRGGQDALGSLTATVREDVDRVLDDLLRQARMRRRDLVGLVFVGNGVMHHLFFGLPVESFGEAPYVPLQDEGVTFSPAELNLRLPPSAKAHFLPLFSGFIGADAMGVALALDLGRKNLSAPVLALDLGTNVEILLATPGEELWCASTPAGPAFEGGEIRCGMPSAPGAISEVDAREGRLEIRTIEGAPPAGICGTGLIEAVGCLLDLGVLEGSGRILSAEELPPRVPESVRSRIAQKDGGRHFVLAEAAQTASGAPIYLNQRDVRHLQSAKAAVRAGAELLLKEAGIGWKALDGIYLAGAFGASLRPESALRIGLLPPFPAGRIHVVHNAAGSGGRLALLSRAKLAQANELKRKARFVELAGRQEFQDAFIQAIPFPSGEG